MIEFCAYIDINILMEYYYSTVEFSSVQYTLPNLNIFDYRKEKWSVETFQSIMFSPSKEREKERLHADS